MLGGGYGHGDVGGPHARLCLYRIHGKQGALAVGDGYVAVVAVACAVDHLHLVALAHAEHAHAVLRVAFGEDRVGGYVGGEELYHCSEGFRWRRFRKLRLLLR